jgi:hypothetical protein
MICLIDNWYIYYCMDGFFMQKRRLRNYTEKTVSMDVLTEEWFYVSLGLCGVCSLYVVVHALHVVSN